MKSELKTHTLDDLAKAYLSGDLRVNREYQRGTKWSQPQKQSLIDSLLRGYQIPLFYVHVKQTPKVLMEGTNTTFFLVDGQQRLFAITDYLKNEFRLPDPDREAPRLLTPTLIANRAPWGGKKFEDLGPQDRDRLLKIKLLVIEMYAQDENEVRDLFIRLQAGTPLTAQEKRDAWPGDFTTFVIRHAGKPEHPASNPKPFFQIVPHGRSLNIDDGDHYVDGLADRRKFFAGLAMTIMVRERSESGTDFVDLKGKTINDFYMGNLELKPEDPATSRVTKTLDTIANLPGFELLLARRPVTHQMAFHLTLLVDSLLSGDYTPDWRSGVVPAFIAFQEEVASARQRYRAAHESSPTYDRFVSLLAGSGSDTADIIRRRHHFFLERMRPAIKILPRDEKRLFDALDKEIIWSRDRQICQCCNQPITFRDATVHHVLEHTAGGPTTLANGILVCRECHSDRAKMQALTPRFQVYLTEINARAQAQPPQPPPSPGPELATTAKQPTVRPTELRIGDEAITVTKSNQIPVAVANWILSKGRTLPTLPNVLHQTNRGFPPSAQPKPLTNGWYIEVGDSQEVLIQRARRLLDLCEFRDVQLQILLEDGTVKTV